MFIIPFLSAIRDTGKVAVVEIVVATVFESGVNTELIDNRSISVNDICGLNERQLLQRTEAEQWFEARDPSAVIYPKVLRTMEPGE